MIEEPVKYITKVEIQGLFGRYDIVWNLHPDVNVLAGINGSGKTTILYYIYDCIRRRARPSFPSLINHDTKLQLTFYNNIKFDWLNDNLSWKDSASLNAIASNLNLIKTFDTDTKPQELLQKAGREVKTELDWELWLLQQEYTKYQVRIYKYNSNINHNTHLRFLEMVDELFSETHKRVNSNKEELEFLLDDNRISVYQLSSGEKQLLVILLTVLVQDNKPSILLMDEPEISLHIEWQRKLIKYIRELNPNAQIIIATHSPAIIMEGWLDKVFNLEDLIVKDSIDATV